MSIAEILTSIELGIIYGIVSLGIYFAFKIINFSDLSCDGSFVLGSTVSCMLIKAQYYPIFSLVGALFAGGLAGGLAGASTGILNTYFKISQLLSGILVAFMLYSINLRILGSPNVALLGDNTIFTNNNPVIVLVTICFIICVILCYLFATPFGLAIRSIGMNKHLAKSSGINVNYMTILGLAISNGLIALAGAIFSQQQGFADVGAGVGTIIVGFASLTIGESMFPSNYPYIQILSCVIGSIIYRLVISVALHSDTYGLESQDLNLITGLLVIFMMILQRKPRKSLC